MKKNYIILFLAALFCASCMNSPRTFNAVSGDVWANLGQVNEEDGLVRFSAVYENDTKDTVYIYRTYASCTCLSVDEIENNYVGPGDKITAKLSYNPAYRNGAEEEYAILRLSSREDITVHVTADVKPCKHPIEEGHPYDLGEGLRASHKVLSYVYLKPGETQDMYIHIANGKDKKAKVVLEPRGEYKECLRFRQPGVMEADGRDTIHFKVTMPTDYESVEDIKFVLQPIVDGVETETPLGVRIVPAAANKD